MASSSLNQLIAAQSARAADLVRLKAKVEEAAERNASRCILEARRDRLNQLWETARRAHEEIVGFNEAPWSQYTLDDSYGKFDNSCSDLSDRILELIGQLEASSISSTNRSSLGALAEAPEPHVIPAKFPKFDLPKFSGNYEDWASFADIFGSFVHNVRSIDNVTKLRYLQCCLTGPAAEFVRDIEITNANYATTWAALEERYANMRITVNRHVQAIRDLPYLTQESGLELRAFSDACQRRLRALAALRMPVDSLHWFILDDLSRRLDPATRELWESELSRRDRRLLENMGEVQPLDRFPAMREFVRFIEERSKTLLALAPMPPPIEEPGRSRKVARSSSRAHHAQGRATSAPAERPNTKEPPCLVCSGPHRVCYCPAFLEKHPGQRVLLLRRLRLCYICLGSHMRKECPSTQRCATCQGNHNTLVHCMMTSPHASGREATDEDNSTSAATSAQVHTCTAPTASIEGTVVLATALVTLVGADGSRHHARALLDQGSEVSFVTERLVQLLRLPKQPANIAIWGVGASHGDTVRSTTKIDLRSSLRPDFQLSATALVLPSLTSRIPTRNLYEIDRVGFAGLELADPSFDKPGRIDLLLGADVYSQILEPGLQHYQRLAAQSTVWGWILSGPTQSMELRRAELTTNAPVVSLHCVTSIGAGSPRIPPPLPVCPVSAIQPLMAGGTIRSVDRPTDSAPCSTRQPTEYDSVPHGGRYIT